MTLIRGPEALHGTLRRLGRAATFTVAASGASTRWKLQADYLCDGTADDVQLNAAIAAAEALGGGKVGLSDGTFNTTASLTVTSGGVEIEGQGRNTVIDHGTTDTDLFSIEDTPNNLFSVVLRSLKITATRGQSRWAIATQRVQHLTLEDVEIENFGADNSGTPAGGGIRLQNNTYHARIAGLRVRGCDHGVRLENLANANNFYEFDVADCHKNIHLDATTDEVRTNSFFGGNNNTGSAVYGVQQEGNVDSTGLYGMFFDGGASTRIVELSAGTRGMVISGCSFAGGVSETPIDLNSCLNVTIVNPRLLGPTSLVTGSGRYMAIFENDILNVSDDGNVTYEINVGAEGAFKLVGRRTYEWLLNGTGGSADPDLQLHAGGSKIMSFGLNVRGSETLSSGTAAVSFGSNEPDASYFVVVTGDANETFYVTNKATSGFTINSSNGSSTANVDWMLLR